MPGLLRDLVALYQHVQDPDKAKREAAMQYYAANPDAYQKLIDSHLADNPESLKQIFGDNARFGGNKNASTSIINNVQSAPLSDTAKAQRLEQVQQINPNDITNASISNIPSLRAYNGLSNNQFQQQVPAIASSIQNNTPNNPQALLSQQQKDMLAKQRTGETSLETRKGEADITLLNAERDSAIANAARTKQATLNDITQGDILTRKNTLEKTSDDLVDSYYASHPDARGKQVTDILRDKTVSPDVRAAFINSGKYGESTKTLLTNDYEQERLALERKGQLLSKQEHDEWLPKLQNAQALDAYAKSGFTGPMKGYLDLFTGQTNTPEAQAAQSIMQTGSPQIKAQSVGQYNSLYNQLQSKLNSKNPPDKENIQNYLDVLNSRAAELRARGINQPDIKYDFIPDSKKGTLQNINGMFESKANLPRSLQTINGEKVSPPIYDPKADPGLIKDEKGKVIDPKTIAELINTGKADRDVTLQDPRLSPAMKAQVLSLLKSQTPK